MRIALVGPTHPFKGGVAVHTTSTAHRLARAGHQVDLVAWSRLYPRRLYPGELTVPGGEPEVPPFPAGTAPLRWDRPLSWWRAGRALRGHDLVVLVTVVPAQVPALLTLARAARAGGGRGPAVVELAHNVLPHESHPGGRRLAELLLRSVDGVLVHSDQQARLATGHGARRVAVAGLPPHLPGGDPPSPLPDRADRPAGGPVRVLGLGLVREYKGFDLLLRAAAEVPGVSVTVAGELWGAAGERVRALTAAPALAGRAVLLPGYLPAARVPSLLLEHDVLALPYRSATGSQNVLLGHAYRMPVLASRVGTFGDQVRDGVDGLLVPPDDEPGLAAALRRLTAPGELDRLRAGVPAVDLDAGWNRYLAALTGLARPAAGPDPAGPDPAGPDPAGPDRAGPDPAGPDPAGPDDGSGR